MKHKKTYIDSASLIIILFLTSSWVKNSQPISFVANYEEVRIGNQVWMTRNLNVATFRNGDTIPEAKTIAEWRKALSKKQPAWCYYNNDSTNGAVYGKLYNWNAVKDKRGLAPVGWHIPSGNEWGVLYDFLGGKKGNMARKLKSTTGWDKKGNGDNTVGFNALPSGDREFDAINNPNNGYRWRGVSTTW